MSGYINMARNRNNNCGIATVGLYPTVATSISSKPTIIAPKILTTITSTKSITSTTISPTKTTAKTFTTIITPTTTASKGGSSSLVSSAQFGSISSTGFSFQINVSSLQQILVYVSSNAGNSNNYISSLGFHFLNGTKIVYGSTYGTIGYSLGLNNLIITGIYIRSSSLIISLQFQLFNPNLNTYMTTVQLGGTSGTLSSLDSASTNLPFLQISSISGFIDSSGQIFSNTFVRSLTFGYIYQPKKN